MFAMTGDVHDMSLGVQDQFRLPSGESEVRISRKYLELLNRYQIAERPQPECVGLDRRVGIPDGCCEERRTG